MVINCFRLNAMSSQSSYVGKKKKKKTTNTQGVGIRKWGL